jgi:hypothetical protein
LLGLISSLALLIIANSPVWARLQKSRSAPTRREVMEKAFQTKQQFDLYGLHFESDTATIQPDSKSICVAASLRAAIYFNVESKNGRGAKC